MEAVLVLDHHLKCTDAFQLCDKQNSSCQEQFVYDGVLPEIICYASNCPQHFFEDASSSVAKCQSELKVFESKTFHVFKELLIGAQAADKTEQCFACSEGKGLKLSSILDVPCRQFEFVLACKANGAIKVNNVGNILGLSVNSYLASAIVYSLRNSESFCLGLSSFVTYIFSLATGKKKHLRRKGKTNTVDSLCMILQEPETHLLNYPWCNRLQSLVTKKVILEEMMAWLSTLGGGYSSLGDFFVEHAEEAGRISLQQLKIAIELGDPVIQSKSRMFFALSLMQKGQLGQSKILLRQEYKFIKEMNLIDDKVRTMWRAIWIKLKYSYQKRRQRDKVLKMDTTRATNGTKKHSLLQVIC